MATQAWPCHPPGAAPGQESQPTAAPPAAEELPERVLSLLNTAEDFSYSFDHPGYYALLEFVKRNPLAPGFARKPIVVDDWQVLLERPGDFRGLPITIEGVIGRNKDPYLHTRHPQLGQVGQVELRGPKQTLTCTVIFTNDVSDLPIGATIRVTGYFVQIRRYPARSNSQGLAALLVAPGPTEVSRPAPPRLTQDGLDWRWLTVAIVLGLMATFVLLRRAAAPRRHDPGKLRARHAAPVSLADELADWAEQEQPDVHERPDAYERREDDHAT